MKKPLWGCCFIVAVTLSLSLIRSSFFSKADLCLCRAHPNTPGADRYAGDPVLREPRTRPECPSGWVPALGRLGVPLPRLDSLSVPIELGPATTASVQGNWSFTGSMTTHRAGHTATLLPNGQVLVTGGGESFYPPYFSTAELYDPATGTWRPTASMSTARAAATATLLLDGRVLVVGGAADYGLASAEIYDPIAETWISTGSLNFARGFHTATLLLDGRGLVVGGIGNSSELALAELYEPATGAWSVAGPPGWGRDGHMTTLLSDGRVLTVGGFTTDEGSRASAEVYNPETGTWSAAGEMSIGRWCAAATRLPDGRVLVAGGWYVNGWASVILDSAELFDPTAPPETAWSETGSMAASRRYHTAGLLPNGRVLVAGGDSDGHPTLTTELYDPATGTWSQAAPMAVAHAYYQTATLLPDGRLLVVGGHDNSTFFADAEVYDSSQASWTAVNALSGTRGEHAAILLADDRVLVTGGQRYDGGWIGLDSTETYDAYTGTWWPAARMGSPRSGHSATLLANGQVLAAGGRNGSPLASAEVYDPAADVWRPTAAMDDARSQHTATLLPSGQVLVAGGDGAMGPLATAELYEPVSGVWLPAGSMGTSRTWHTATLLPNGAVLVAGGYNQDLGWLAGVELYDPATGTWSAVASLAQGRGRHRATLLPDGRVLVAGGIGDGDAALATAEVYDPACGCWSTTGSLAHARAGYEEIVLRDGHVLVAGGFDPATGVQPSSEVYNPATGTWSLDATANVAAAEHTLTLLPGGQVLAAGGLNGNSALGSAQVYDRGLGYDPAWRPSIDSVPASLLPGDPVVVTGSGFRGHGFVEAASSTYSSSPTNYPLVQLQRLDNGQVRWLLPDSLHPFSDTLFTSVPVTELAAGPYLVTVFVNGIDSASQMTCVLAEPVNHPPQIEAIEPEAVDELVTLSFLVPASDPDAGDKLTFSLAPDAPAGAMVGPATGEFSWIPTEAQGPGTYSVTVVVADSGIPPLSDVALFTVTVHEVNQAPVAANDVHTVGQDMVLDVPAPGVSGNDVDLDLPRQALTVTLQTGPFHGNLFLGMDGGFVYTPALSFRNIDTFTYAVSDGELGDVAVVTLTVGTAGVQTIYLPVVIRGGG